MASSFQFIHFTFAVFFSEVLSQPLLEIHADIKLYGAKKMKLICHVLYNARAPAPPVHYYFYKNNEQLGMAKSKNYDLVTKALGQYSCRVKVPQLDLVRRSKPSSFGDLPGKVNMKFSWFGKEELSSSTISHIILSLTLKE